jgi:glucokinase
MQPNLSGQYVVGVDVGGTNSRAAVFTLDGKRLGEGREPTFAERGPSVVVEQVSRAIEAALTDAGVRAEDVAGAGIGMPGRITPEGVVLWSPNFPDIEGVPLLSLIQERTGVPIRMENDVNIAALGEFTFGAGRDVQSLVMLTLGTGIGGGIVLNGQVWSGANAGGAEIGHMVVNPGGRQCGCGNHGCLEAMAQRDAIVERAVLKFQSGRPSALAEAVEYQADRITPALIAEFAGKGDQVCLETMAETGHWVGIGVANMINILNPEMVIIGGGISQAGPILWEPLMRGVRSYAIHESLQVCRVVPAELGDDAGIMGGVAMIMKAIGKS